MNNSIYLRRKNTIFIKTGENRLEKKYLLGFLQNIKSLGFTLSKELLNLISTLSIDQIGKLHKEVIAGLREMVGADVEYKPMYVNFPQEVMEMSDAELYTNSAIHYFGDLIGIRLMPEQIKIERPSLGIWNKYQVINSGTKEDFDNIFVNIISSKIAVSDVDKADMTWFIKNYGSSVYKLFPDSIKNKEILSFLVSEVLKIENNDVAINLLQKNIKTATDILRIASAMSGGDASLSQNTKFKSFTRKERRFLLSNLDGCLNIIEDMFKNKDRWIRLGERLHPNEKRFNFKNVSSAFDVLRNIGFFRTFHSNLQSLFSANDFAAAVDLVSKRPGEFARKLDFILRSTTNQYGVINSFGSVIDKVSTNVLLQLIAHFKNRNNLSRLRVFFPKSILAKFYGRLNNLAELKEEFCQSIINLCENALLARFKLLKPLGNVFVDEKLKNYTVPFSLRSASKTLKTVSRGSKFDLPNSDTVRFFLWWKDGTSRTDIDLSSVGLDENYKFITGITYYNLSEFGGYHSGDITSAPYGASEFIDIHIPTFLSKNVRYVIMSLNSFTQQPFCDLPECFAGFMSRAMPNSGEIYEPRTVETKIDLASSSKICLPLIIDLKSRQVIWTDLSLKSMPSPNNVVNNLKGISLVAEAMTNLKKLDLYYLFNLHAKARGMLVSDITLAETIFSEHEGITPYDPVQITANFI